MKYLTAAATVVILIVSTCLVDGKPDPRLKDVPPDVRRMLEKNMKNGGQGAGGAAGPNGDMDPQQGVGQKPFITNFGQECLFSCPNGAKPTRRLHHIPKFDGCGLATGTEVQGLDFRTTKEADFRSCCNDHDKCYNSCGKLKEKCDSKYLKCMQKWCEVMHDEDYLQLNTDEEKDKLRVTREKCMKRAELFNSAHKLMGCQMYLDGQMDACNCDGAQSQPGQQRRDTRSPRDEL